MAEPIEQIDEHVRVYKTIGTCVAKLRDYFNLGYIVDSMGGLQALCVTVAEICNATVKMTDFGAIFFDEIDNTAQPRKALKKLAKRQYEKPCHWVYDYSESDTPLGHEVDYANWIPNCGCWIGGEGPFVDYDDYAQPPTHIKFCERCGREIVV